MNKSEQQQIPVLLTLYKDCLSSLPKTISSYSCSQMLCARMFKCFFFHLFFIGVYWVWISQCIAYQANKRCLNLVHERIRGALA